LLRRYGRFLRLEERRLKLGQYLFLKHGGKVVFFVRFVAVLRAFAVFLAGTNRMPWPRFFFFNATGGMVWATLYGLGGYFLRDNIHRLTGTLGIIVIILAALLIIGFLLFLRRNEHRLEDEAERALPGHLMITNQEGHRRSTVSKERDLSKWTFFLEKSGVQPGEMISNWR